MTSPAERFLIDFHARHAGATALALGQLPVTCDGRAFPSSYELLAAQVPAAATALLDVACGDGYLLSLIAGQRPAIELTGVDMSGEELAAAGSRLQRRATLRRCRAQELPFEDGSFDVVVSHLALMLMDDSPLVLAEIRRVLAKPGTLAAMIGSAMPASAALDLYRDLLKPLLAESAAVVPLGDKRWRTPEGIGPMLEAAGFTGVLTSVAEAEIKLAPAALWDWLMLMYDAHFVDEATRVTLRSRYLAAIVPSVVEPDGTVRLPVAWRLVTASAD